jgi:hypothetical protein
MSQEITLTAALGCRLNGSARRMAVNIVMDWSGTEYVLQTQAIGDTATALDFGAISGAPGMVMLVHRDSSKSLTLSTDAGGLYLIAEEMQPGSPAIWTPTSGTVYGIGGAPLEVSVMAIDTLTINTVTLQDAVLPDDGVLVTAGFSMAVGEVGNRPGAAMSLNASYTETYTGTSTRTQQALHNDVYVDTSATALVDAFGTTGHVSNYVCIRNRPAQGNISSTAATIYVDEGATHPIATVAASGGFLLIPYRGQGLWAKTGSSHTTLEVLSIGPEPEP